MLLAMLRCWCSSAAMFIISAIASVLVDVAAHYVPVAFAVAVDSAVAAVISVCGVA